MRFIETGLKGLYLLEIERLEDERGYFARYFCREEFARHGLNPDVSQCSVSFNKKAGTLRGMHYQTAPHEEDKLVQCVEGRIFDVAVDVRPDSPTYKKWFGVELSGRLLYIPKGFAHGFLTLEDCSMVYYQMSEPYTPGNYTGFSYADKTVGIDWPFVENLIISDKDKNHPCLP